MRKRQFTWEMRDKRVCESLRDQPYTLNDGRVVSPAGYESGALGDGIRKTESRSLKDSLLRDRIADRFLPRSHYSAYANFPAHHSAEEIEAYQTGMVVQQSFLQKYCPDHPISE
jgi:hypothetical protein